MLISNKHDKRKPTRPSTNPDDDSAFSETDWYEPEEETNTRDLAGPDRSPIEESFYESYIIQSRTAVDNLYASNVLSCQKHTKELADLARQRKVKLLSLEREQKKLVKRMEELKLKQEAVTSRKKRPKTTTNESKEPTNTNNGAQALGTERRRGSLPPLNTSTADTEDTDDISNASERVKSPARLGLPGNTLSKSCNDLTSLCEENSTGPKSNLILPAIHNDLKPSRSLENVRLSGSPFVTHPSLKVHKDPHTSRGLLSRESQPARSLATRPLSWNENQFKNDISTKVKWVPRS